jgi:hypothetical protein
MMSCLVLTAWNRTVLSLCCTEHDPSCDAVLLGHITTVAMFRLRAGMQGTRSSGR